MGGIGTGGIGTGGIGVDRGRWERDGWDRGGLGGEQCWSEADRRSETPRLTICLGLFVSCGEMSPVNRHPWGFENTLGKYGGVSSLRGAIMPESWASSRLKPRS